MSIKRAHEMTGIEFAMAFLDSLPPGYTTESYAVALMDRWRVGDDHEGKGVLFLFIEDLGEMKIEVSYELEPTFTDGFCKSFQETIKNYFASRHFGDVITNSINNMTRHYLGEPMETIDHLSLGSHIGSQEGQFLSGGGGIIEREYIFDKEAKLRAIREIEPELLVHYSASESLAETVDLFLDSLEAGISHPDLDILTPGSRYMRIEYPKTSDFQKREYRTYMKAMPYRILHRGDLAAVRFAENKAVPILCIQGPDQKWRVDLPKTWGLAQGSNDFSTYSVTSYVNRHPWEFAFPDLLTQKGRFDVTFSDSYGDDPAKEIATLQRQIEERSEDAELYLRLAKLLYWDCYLIHPAIEAAETAIELTPNYSEARWFAINARFRAPALEGIQAHYEALLRLHPNDSNLRRQYERFIEITGNL